MKTESVYVLAILFFSACASSPTAPLEAPLFVSHQKVELLKRYDGINGTLEVLRDRRLTTDAIARLEQHDPDNNPSRDSEYSKTSLRKARLELKTPDGRVLSSIELEKPYAALGAVAIDPHYRAVLVTQDFGIGMGSYNGPITKIIDVSHGTLAWSKARSRSKDSEITLMRSLKSAWNLTPAPVGQDILEVSCRPEGDASRFITTYSRYHYDGAKWTVSSRRKRGFWEADDGNQQLGATLPEATKFPPPLKLRMGATSKK